MHDLMLTLAMGSPPEGSGAAGFAASLLPIVAMIAILWFLLIRPQQKEQKKHQEMVQNLKKGDEVTTVGGLHGKIMALDPETVSLRIADGVKVDVERGKVAQLRTPKVEEVEAES